MKKIFQYAMIATIIVGSLSTYTARAADFPTNVIVTNAFAQEVICSDYAHTMTKSVPLYKYVSRLPLSLVGRGLWLLMTSSKARSDVSLARQGKLKDAQGNSIIGSNGYIDYVVNKYMPTISQKKREALYNCIFYTIPNIEIIDHYQWIQEEQGKPVYIFTNDPEAEYKQKLDILNQVLAEQGHKPFKPDGFYCPQDGIYKNDPLYFKHAYQHVVDQVGGNPTIIFIDDNPEFVENAKKAATDFHLNGVIYSENKETYVLYLC